LEDTRALVALVKKKLVHLKRTSTSGYPIKLNKGMSTIGALLDDEELSTMLVMATCERLLKLLFCTPEEQEAIARDPYRAVLEGFSDPISTFPKDEPHKKSKVLEKRWRVICSLGVVDQLVERALFDPFAAAQKAIFPECPSAMGLGTSPELTQLLGDRFTAVDNSTAGHPVCGDIKQWDGSMSVQLLHASVCHVHNPLMKPNGSVARYHAAMETWVLLRTNPLYVVGDSLYVKNRVGQMPSGTMGTTPFNCIARRVAAKVVKSENEINLGDDCIEWNTLSVTELVAAYWQIGYTLRDAQQVVPGNGFEFCSHQYSCVGGEWTCWLLNWPRAAFKLLANKPHLDEFYGTIASMANNPLGQRIRVLSAFVKHLMSHAAVAQKDAKEE